MDEVAIRALSDSYPAFSRPWRDQVSELHDELGRVADLRFKHAAEPGTKGGTAEIIIALGSSGAVAAAAAVLKHWLSRDTSRKITLHVRRRDVEITLDADSLTDRALSSLLSPPGRDE